MPLTHEQFTLLNQDVIRALLDVLPSDDLTPFALTNEYPDIHQRVSTYVNLIRTGRPHSLTRYAALFYLGKAIIPFRSTAARQHYRHTFTRDEYVRAVRIYQWFRRRPAAIIHINFTIRLVDRMTIAQHAAILDNINRHLDDVAVRQQTPPPPTDLTNPQLTMPTPEQPWYVLVLSPDTTEWHYFAVDGQTTEYLMTTPNVAD